MHSATQSVLIYLWNIVPIKRGIEWFVSSINLNWLPVRIATTLICLASLFLFRQKLLQAQKMKNHKFQLMKLSILNNNPFTDYGHTVQQANNLLIAPLSPSRSLHVRGILKEIQQTDLKFNVQLNLFLISISIK